MVGKLIKENLERVHLQITESLRGSHRSLQDIKIVAVTKKQSLPRIQECLDNQLYDLGENYLQEAQAKKEQLNDSPINWHFIGSVQSKKVKSMLNQFCLWHAVDRLSVFEELDKRNQGEAQELLIQVNVAEEASKSGVKEEDLPLLLDQAQGLKGFTIKGLMTMPPIYESELTSRKYFAKLRKILGSCKKRIDTRVHPMNDLSMGTSQDYTWAIQEGATLIRLGEILVGPRESV